MNLIEMRRMSQPTNQPQFAEISTAGLHSLAVQIGEIMFNLKKKRPGSPLPPPRLPLKIRLKSPSSPPSAGRLVTPSPSPPPACLQVAQDLSLSDSDSDVQEDEDFEDGEQTE